MKSISLMIHKYKKLFNEKFYIGFKYNSNYFEVFENPTGKEYSSISSYRKYDSVRAFVTRDRLYVWDSSVLHEYVYRDNLFSINEDYIIAVNITGKLGGSAVIYQDYNKYASEIRKLDKSNSKLITDHPVLLGFFSKINIVK